MNNTSRVFMKIFSDRDRQIYELVNYIVVTGVICVFGITTNIMNIMVFYKQGFNNTMTISFFGLAISDLCNLVTLLWFGVCVNPLFINADTTIIPQEVQHLTAGIPHICFTRITGWITVFITAERCLCITIPLKIKQIITTRRTTIIICSLYILITATFVPEYATTFFGYKFNDRRNKTLIGLLFTHNRKHFEGLAFFLHSLLGSSSFVAVITFTVILVVQLNRKSQWRISVGIDKQTVESTSSRERKTMKMVVMIAIVLIVCLAPGAAVSMVTFFQPEFSIVGKYVNAFFVLWSFVFVFEAINSSVNILLYYHMSSKYRETFHLLFGACIRMPTICNMARPTRLS